MYISLTDLAWFILFSFAVAISVLLIIALANVIGTIKKINTILEKNENNINETLSTLPKVMDNVHQSTEVIKDGLFKTEDTIDALTTTVFNTTHSVHNKTETFLNYIVIVAELAKGLYEYFVNKTGEKK
ncbi:hypothetical protein SAMN02745227_00510 [Anaerobranca californiensis DSM 14826]|jgi:predicted PurR-regulated permease PerM|uniref:DUF948 domain-containing protein n=1 Tax=Anaerobranca californiensis DSM 14826 TaxID=1120989 RepID=A0A1M6LHD8_9FIRM|nr:hypothetical protein [Anaerobranca californiensis]SHJ70599.1 hypothetical protein SAMN02745227_00510 [Anaerobranca californiensis DSM 14826]